jgi:hypothetical protein
MRTSFSLLNFSILRQGKLECGSAAVAGRQLQLNTALLSAAPDWLLAALTPQHSAILLDTAGSAPETNECGGVYNIMEAKIMVITIRWDIFYNFQRVQLSCQSYLDWEQSSYSQNGFLTLCNVWEINF